MNTLPFIGRLRKELATAGKVGLLLTALFEIESKYTGWTETNQ